jgi:CheY-like chemotaxis protein
VLNGSAPISVLVIDDNAINLKLATAVLTTAGFAVTTAADGAEGLAAIRDNPPALVYCDVQLPDADGIELVRHLKADPATADLVVVALTACAMESDRRRALAAGCDGFIAKPIDTRTLGPETHRFLAGRGAGAQ